LIPSQIQLDKIKYSDVKKTGGKDSIYLTHNGSPFIIQTPIMRCPFNYSKWDNSKENDKGAPAKEVYKYDLLMSFDGKDKEPEEGKENHVRIFHDKMDGLDKKIAADGLENSLAWIGKKINSMAAIEELYKPMIKYSIDKNTGEPNTKYAPNIKVTLPVKNGKIAVDAYGPDKKEVDLSTINLQGARVTALIQCTGIWVVNKNFGCSWKVLQMKVYPKSNIPKYAIRELPDENVPEDEEEPASGAAADDDILDDSDDELDRGAGKKK
jgi:hypothetical protein